MERKEKKRKEGTSEFSLREQIINSETKAEEVDEEGVGEEEREVVGKVEKEEEGKEEEDARGG